jgi:predicted ATPase
MYIKKTIVHRYKPLAHAGTTTLTIETMSDIGILIGNNGCGKSTLLKELTPLPSVSTDYEDGGYKHIEIEHNELPYIIRSQFDGKKGIHSFVKDNVELNVSGTSSVQQDLCETEFGLTAIIRSIVSGTIEICNIPKGERREVLLACYPSNLSFVLAHHRRIVSELRDISTNLKLLYSKKAELEALVMPEDLYRGLLQTFDQANALKLDLDRAETVYLNERDNLTKNQYYDTTVTSFDFQAIQLKSAELNSTCARWRLAKPELFQHAPDVECAKLSTSIAGLHNEIGGLDSEMHGLLEEVNRFEQLTSDMAESRIKEYENRLSLLKERKAKISIDPTIPLINPELAKGIDLEKVRYKLNQVHSLGGGVLTPSAYNELQLQLNGKRTERHGLSVDLNQSDELRKRLADRLDRVTAAKFRAGCTLGCGAREKHADMLTQLQNEYTEVIERLTTITERSNRLTLDIFTLQERYDHAGTAVGTVSYLESLLTQYELHSPLLAEATLVDILNTNPMSLYNKLKRIVDTSIDHGVMVALESEIAELEARLLSLLEARRETMGVLKESIASKNNKLTLLAERRRELVSKISTLEEGLLGYAKVRQLATEISGLKNMFDTRMAAFLVNKKIEMFNSIIADIRDYRKLVEEEQVSIRTTLKEKESYRIRLEEEVLPTINKLVHQQIDLDKLEKALSPSTGLPHLHMVRFTNGILNVVNLLISKVWNYDLQLLPLKESEPLDYTFPVQLYGQPALKDISMLSKGQKEIANLAFVLATFIRKKLGKIYPLKLDEPDGGLSFQHRDKLLSLLSELVHTGEIGQMYLVNHFSGVYTGFSQSQIICLDSTGIVVPPVYNTGVTIN